MTDARIEIEKFIEEHQPHVQQLTDTQYRLTLNDIRLDVWINSKKKSKFKYHVLDGDKKGERGELHVTAVGTFLSGVLKVDSLIGGIEKELADIMGSDDPKLVRKVALWHRGIVERQLDDLENRVQQFIEVNENFREDKNNELIEWQQRGFYSVLMLIDQIKSNGKVNRGNQWFPDPLNDMIEDSKYKETS